MVKQNLKKMNFNLEAWGIFGISIIIGIAGGLFAVLFRKMIGWSHEGFYGAGQTLFGFLPGGLWKMFVPALAGLIVGPLTYFLAREAKGHGVPEVMESVALKGGRMRMRVIFVKAIASASSIGSGASVGREGPIVQMGSGIGSTIAQWFRMNEERTKICVGCGAAAGIAATFNAPIAGVIFAHEVILGKFTSTTFVPMVVSSVTASVIMRVLVGDAPAFLVQSHSLIHPVELLFYAVLGIISAGIALLFTKALYKTEDLIDTIKVVPEWSKPIFGGVLIGFMGLKFPQILGVGYETIEGTFHGEFVLWMLAALVFIKIIATSLTLGSGHSGGVFAPSLFIGSTLGGAFGLVVSKLFPVFTGNPAAYAIVGMGAVVAGTTQAPITAIMIIFEMTRDYRLILPLMIAVVISTLIFSLFSNGSIYTLKLLRRGVNIEFGRDVNIMKMIKVEEVMSSPVEVVSHDDTAGNLIKMMHDSRHNGFPVLNEEGELMGIVTLQDVREVPVEGIMELPIPKLMTRKLITTFPDETLDDVFGKLRKYGIGHLPVVNRENHKQLIGIITRSDIIKAYDKKTLSPVHNKI